MREGKRHPGFLHGEQKSIVKQLHADSGDRAHALKCELAAQVLRSFGTLRLEVTGLSMLPSVWPGDILFIDRREMEQVAAGDIVLFARQGGLVAHRVLWKTAVGDSVCAVTRGDAQLLPDDPVSPAELLGSVHSILRAGEYVEPRTRLGSWALLLVSLLRRYGWAARTLAFVHRLRSHLWRRKTA
jgi:signal peptidase I